MTPPASRFAIVVATVTLILSPALRSPGHRAATPPGPYWVTDLGTLGGGSAHAHDINAGGQVAGQSTTSASQSRGFLWQDGHMTNLGTLGTASVANGLNSHGQVVGYSGALGVSRAVLWSGGAIVDLIPGAEGQGSNALAINDAGHVVGTIGSGNAFLWQNGVRTGLGHLGGGGSFPSDINGAGQVVGASYSTHVTALGLMQHAFLWQNGVMTDLGLLPGDEDSGASAINSLGEIVGSTGRTDAETYETMYRPFLYRNSMMTAIPVPSFDSHASDINDAGVVVGTMKAGGGFSKHHAWIYADGVVTNLNTLIPAGSGLHIAYANAINNEGQIAGVAVNAQGHYRAVLLTPFSLSPPPVVTPAIRIGDITQAEGNSGTTPFTFTVSLSSATGAAVSVNYSTANGSAIAGSDYASAAGTLVFNPGELTKSVVVGVVGDRKREQNEGFTVNLSGASGATIADGQGAAVIRDDDK